MTFTNLDLSADILSMCAHIEVGRVPTSLDCTLLIAKVGELFLHGFQQGSHLLCCLQRLGQDLNVRMIIK